MPAVHISLENLAGILKKLKAKEISALLLTKDHRELVKRKTEIEHKKVKPLSRHEVFNV